MQSCSLPRWRVNSWLVDAGQDVPADIRLALIKSLYGTLPIFAGGVINTVAVAGLIAARNPSPPFIGWLLLEAVLAVVRLAVLFISYRRGQAGQSTPTDLYLMLAVIWAASVGYGTFISITSGDWVSATLACLSAAAMVGGICFRNYGAPRLVGVMILLSLGPCALGAVLSGEPILLVVALQIPFYLISMAMAAYRLNGILLSTMRAERENDYRARHDALTGLLNRAGLVDALRSELPVAEAAGGTVVLFYLDLDGFKPINDAYGHAAGDRLLQLVARRLEDFAQRGDLVARLGGDEFVLLSTIENHAAAAVRGDAIIASVSGKAYDVGGTAMTIGVSVGAALVCDHGTNVETLLGAADAALYDAKQRGRGRCSVADATKPGPMHSQRATQLRKVAG